MAPSVIAERFGAWAAEYFDGGQALWAAPRGRGAYALWRAIATHDLTPEFVGLARFETHLCDAPESAQDAIVRVASRLELHREAMETYFHQMLTTMGGWGQHARYKLWHAGLGGASDETITNFLAIRLLWEEVLFDRHAAQIESQWEKVRAERASPVLPRASLVVDEILQEAWERASQHVLAEAMTAPCIAARDSRLRFRRPSALTCAPKAPTRARNREPEHPDASFLRVFSA